MSDEKRKQAIEGLNVVLRDLNHWEFSGEVARASVQSMRDRILDGLDLIYEQENIIKALMGDYGDACEVDEGCEGN